MWARVTSWLALIPKWFKSITGHHFLVYLGLSTIAVAQPLLDLYGRNLTVFSAAKLSRFEAFAFLVVAVLFLPVLAIVVESGAKRVNHKAGKYAHIFFVWLFSTAFMLLLFHQIKVRPDLIVYPLSVALGGTTVWSYLRHDKVAKFCGYLSVASLVVSVLFVFTAKPVLFNTDVTFADATLGQKDTPALLLVLDEFPIYALLDDEGNINAERFPGFAELASSSTWHRNALAVSNFTHQAVPAVLSGKLPDKSAQPFLLDHKKNIFTLFGAVMPIDGYEAVTTLCPQSLCSQRSGGSKKWDTSRFLSFLKDASVVLGHKLLPQSTAGKLPSVEGKWGGFNIIANRFEENFTQGPSAQIVELETTITNMVTETQAGLHVTHILLPHRPWRLMPDGRAMYMPAYGDSVIPGSVAESKGEYQRLQYQLMELDSEIHRMITRLKDHGIWDRALIVVTADHGITVMPGLPSRNSDLTDPGQVEDIYRIPMFVKAPGQTSGNIDDCDVNSLDVVPTFIDGLDLETDWTFDGQSMLGDCITRKSREITTPEGLSQQWSLSTADLISRSDYYNNFIPRTGGVDGVLAGGVQGVTMGADVTTSGQSTDIDKLIFPNVDEFANISDDPNAVLPGLVGLGVLVAHKIPATAVLLVLVDGKVAGVVDAFSGSEPGLYSANVVLDYRSLTPGSHVAKVVIRYGGSGGYTYKDLVAPSK